MPLMTIPSLAKAIQQKMKISYKEALQYAQIVMDHFGFNDFIIDNCLDHHDRKVFYRLQSEGFLYTQQDTALLEDGRNWRIHYWMFQTQSMPKRRTQRNTRALLKKSNQHHIPAPQVLYSKLPAEAWAARKHLPV